ncbi:MAG: Jag N-terminal domain-containing protein [Bacilli bacterium]|jgi:spoIIIJ-associated protein|nr:Jag N-terminal domain-containing protein [Bacilli bacterium]
MKEFEGKTVDEAVKKALEELKVPAESLKYDVLVEQKGLFKKYAKIGVYEASDANDYAAKYLESILAALDLKATIQINVIDDIIHLDMTSDADASRIIGRGGETLRALNELVRAAIFNKFGEHYRILLNINNYKDQKYDKLAAMAQRVANTVRRTKITAELQPMTSDERRVIHNALSNDPHIKTLSIGAGKDRHITIQYVDIAPDGTPVQTNSEEKDNVEENAPKADLEAAFEQKEEELPQGAEEPKEEVKEEPVEEKKDDSPFEKTESSESGKL